MPYCSQLKADKSLNQVGLPLDCQDRTPVSVLLTCSCLYIILILQSFILFVVIEEIMSFLLESKHNKKFHAATVKPPVEVR